MGYAWNTYALWLGITKILDEDKPKKNTRNTGVLDSGSLQVSFGGLGYHMTWQTSVFLPRELPVDLMVIISAVFVVDCGGCLEKVVVRFRTSFWKNTTLDMSEVQQSLMVSIGLFYSSSKN